MSKFYIYFNKKKMNKEIDKYIKNKIQGLIILVVKFKGYNSRCSYKLGIICYVYF